MSTESEKGISVEQTDMKKSTLYEGDDSSEDVLPKKMKSEYTSDREDWSPSKETDCNDEDEEIYEEKPKIKKRKYLQRYSARFENDPVFRGWVKASSRGSAYAYCIPCGAHLKVTAGKTDLRKHSENKKHRSNVKSSHGGENCITAHVLGEEQPIAKVELPVSNKDSKSVTLKKHCLQKYSYSFEDDPLLQKWVTASAKGDFFAHCIPCDIEVEISAGGKLDLKRHAKNKKHIRAMGELEQNMLSKSRPDEQCITAYLPDPAEGMDLQVNTVQIRTSMDEVEDIQKSPMRLEINSFTKSPAKQRRIKEDLSYLTSRVHEAELEIAAFIARHGLPIDTSGHLIKLVKSVCLDSSIAQNLESKGTDMMLLINDVLGKDRYEEVMQLLREDKFSLIVDESSERGLEKHLIMVVRVLHNYSIIEAFLGLIPLTEATAESLYDDVVEFFNKNLIPYKKNMIGIAADGGNALLGDHRSLSSLLKEDIPHLFVMKCISHSFSLCASCACLKLPQSLEDLARDIYSYFQFTPNHIDLKEFEAFTCMKPYKLLHPEQTRWLSAHVVVAKILEKYDSLQSFFTDATLVDKLEAPDTILQRLSVPVTKLYLMFLDFVLPMFDNLDRHMQSESTQIHILHNAVGMTLKAIFECYLQDTYVKSKSLKDINHKDETNFKPMEEMYLGIKVHMEITNSTVLQDEDLRDFRINCLEFLIEGISQISERFSYGCHILESLENLNPKMVIEKSAPSLIDLICNFEHLATPDIQIVDSEWRLLRNMIESLPLSSSMRPEVFWDTVSKARQIDNILMCPNLSEFMLKLLCLPNSTAAVDKIISTINKMKAKSTTISTKDLMGLMYTNQVIRYKS